MSDEKDEKLESEAGDAEQLRPTTKRSTGAERR